MSYKNKYSLEAYMNLTPSGYQKEIKIICEIEIKD